MKDTVQLQVPTYYPAHHSKAGQLTLFLDKMFNGAEISEINFLHPVGSRVSSSHPKCLLISSEHNKLYLFDNWFALVNDTVIASIGVNCVQPIRVFPEQRKVFALVSNATRWAELPEAYLLRMSLFLGYDGIDDFFDWHNTHEELYVYSWISQKDFLGELPVLSELNNSFLVEYGTLAGDICHREVNGFPCEGVIEEPDGSCSCHINPPCAKCMEPLQCSQCDWNSNLA